METEVLMANGNPPDPLANRTHQWEDEKPIDVEPWVEETGVFTCGLCGCALADEAARMPCKAQVNSFIEG